MYRSVLTVRAIVCLCWPVIPSCKVYNMTFCNNRLSPFHPAIADLVVLLCIAAVLSCVPAMLQVLNYALRMHSVVGDAAKVKAGSAGAAFRAEVAEATARAAGARCGIGQQVDEWVVTRQQPGQQQL